MVCPGRDLQGVVICGCLVLLSHHDIHRTKCLIFEQVRGRIDPFGASEGKTEDGK